MELSQETLLMLISIIVTFNTVVLVPVLKWALSLEKRVLYLEALDVAEGKLKG